MGERRDSVAMNRPDAEPDGFLASRIAAGDEAAFMEAYDRHADALFGVVTRLLGDRDTASEIVQETYLALWQRAALFDPGAGTMRGWLMRIARNRTIDRLRADARRPRLARSIVGVGEESERLERTPTAGGPADDPEASFEARWTRAVVRTALTIVPPDERQVLVLAYDDGLSQSEIAERLAIPIGTVKSRTRRALARLREMLATVPDLASERQRGRAGGSR
jgi:RNA polymerase sigma-70 factor (ECF subfamily)